MEFMKSLKLSGFLSFPPNSEPVELTPLNALIGPNGSGKSNFIEAIELLHALPTSFSNAIREGGGIREWLWKGDAANGKAAAVEAIVNRDEGPPLRYGLHFNESADYRTEITEEVIEEENRRNKNDEDVFFYYRSKDGHAVIRHQIVQPDGSPVKLDSKNLSRSESVLSQYKDPALYLALTWLGHQFNRIQTFREWSFGRYASTRQPQPADLPSDLLSEDSRNLGLILSELEHSNARNEFYKLLSRFMPRYERFSTRIIGGTVQFYLHEQGLREPIPASRLSDGTIRFLAMLALLLSPTPPSLLCMEEPELGLHPDAVSLLGDLLVEASSRMQIVVTTHSDTLVSALSDNADSVLVCDYLGGTVMNRVESKKLQYWLDRYRLGEIWQLGELGGNP